MATVKVAQLRVTLEQFATLYDQAGASEPAVALRILAKSMKRADKLTVDDLLIVLEKAMLKSATDKT